MPSIRWLLFDAFTTLLALVIYLWLRRQQSSSRYPFPPGPKSVWFSNVIALDHPWREYAKWKRLYGDVCYVHAYGNPIVILNSSIATRELFEKRSTNYSSRTVRPMLNELMGWNWIFSSMPYGDRWRKHRRLFQKHFHPVASLRYLPIQVKETNTLLQDLLRDPKQFARHVRRSSAAITLMISYGYQVAPANDMYVTLADEALASLGQAGLFGTYLVDYIPFLKHVPSWMPGASFKRKAKKWSELAQAMNNWPYTLTKQKMTKGCAVPSIAVSELEALDQGTDGGYYDEQIVQNVAGISYAAGAETTVSVILAFILAMTLYPDVQAKAQAEVDSVVGNSRLPTLDDRDQLPYINGIVYESLRWNPVLPLGLAHKAVKDDVYRGMFIPENATIYANVWAILHDSEAYPEPHKFLPERYANSLTPGINKYPIEAFGFGRRICPGRYLAEVTVWLAVSNILAAFKISPAVDDHGNRILPDGEFSSGALSRPKPFICNISPRSEETVALIQQALVEP